MLPHVIFLSIFLVSPQVIADTSNELGKSTVELIKELGYLAKAFKFLTSDGYGLNIIRANNPLIKDGRPGGLKNKSVVIFIHGVTTNTQSWVINSRGAKPQNYAHLSAGEMSGEDLRELLANDPTTNSFPLTLLNFGHEVWLMDRRPTTASQAHLNQFKRPSKDSLKNSAEAQVGGSPLDHHGGPSIGLEQASSKIIPELNAIQIENGRNPRYWNFSFDQQASYDLPELVDFVLEETQRKKLTLLGHSSGGAIILMALAEGKISKNKLQHVMLWAPAMDLGHSRTNLFVKLAPIIEPLLINYLGGIFPTDLTPLAQTAISKICTPKLLRLICQRPMLDLLAGEGGLQQQVDPKYLIAWPIPTGSLEAVQLAQSINRKAMHHFDYLSPKKNMIAYGSPKAPIYNVSNIDFEFMSIWTGNTDNLVTPTDTQNLLKRLKVPVEAHMVGGKGDFFQHFSFLLHSNVSRLLNIPSLKSLERADTM